MLQEIKGRERIERSVFKDLILCLRIVLRDGETRGARFLDKVMAVLHAEGLHRVLRENLQEFSLAAARLQDLLSLQAAQADPLIVLGSPEAVHGSRVAAGADHVPVVGHRARCQAAPGRSPCSAQPDRDPLFRVPVLRARQVLGRCRHVLNRKKRLARKRRAAGSAALQILSPFSSGREISASAPAAVLFQFPSLTLLPSLPQGFSVCPREMIPPAETLCPG